jgi:arylsulfatase
VEKRNPISEAAHVSDGLCVGYDSGDAVSQEYTTPGTLKGGSIRFVEVAVDKAQYLDREMELKRALRD